MLRTSGRDDPERMARNRTVALSSGLIRAGRSRQPGQQFHRECEANGDRWRGRLAIPLRGIAGALASGADGRNSHHPHGTNPFPHGVGRGPPGRGSGFTSSVTPRSRATECPGETSTSSGCKAWATVNGLRPLGRVRDLAFHQRTEIEAGRGVRAGHRGEQRPGVRMDRVLEQPLARRYLHQMARAHHRDAVRHVIDHREVVGDEQVGQPQLRLEGPSAGSGPAPVLRRRGRRPARRR